MSIHQLSITHDEREDRLLLRLNTQAPQEFQVWLTRRMALRLLPALDQALLRLEAAQPGVTAIDAPAQHMLTELKHHAFLQTADFATPYMAVKTPAPEAGSAPTVPNAPIVAIAPLLVTAAHLTLQGNGSLQVVLEEKMPHTDQNYQLLLPTQLVHGMAHLIRQAMAQAGWSAQAAGPLSDSAAAPTSEPGQPIYKH